MRTRKKYSKPELLTYRPHVLDDQQEEASLGDVADVERLRPLYLLSERTDLTPIATRLEIRGDRRRGEWQKVLHDPGMLVESEQPDAGDALYFLGYVPHSIHFNIEFQTLGPDAKTRIAVASEVSIPSDGRLGLFLLSKKRGLASVARLT
jgi:hypothetical protein